MSQAHFDRIISIIKNMLPKDEKMPKNYNKSKQMVKMLGLGYQKIHLCINDCMLFYKEIEHKTYCSTRGSPRFKPKPPANRKQKDIQYKVLQYFPITPRFQRLYMSIVASQHMTFTSENGRKPCFFFLLSLSIFAPKSFLSQSKRQVQEEY